MAKKSLVVKELNKAIKRGFDVAKKSELEINILRISRLEKRVKYLEKVIKHQK